MSVERETTASRPQRATFVELIRLLLVGVFTGGGWQIAEAFDLEGTELLLAVVLGSLIGYVIGGVVGRRAAVAVSVVEREMARVPAADLLAGVVGLIFGLIITALLSIFLFRLPPVAAYPSVALVAIVLGYGGYRLGRAKREELFGMFGLRSRSLGVRSSEVNILDTSALIDGRILQVVEAGFLGGSLLVHRGVLRELQTIADSSDQQRRVRGQRGLDILQALRRIPSVEVLLVEEDEPTDDVDATLVRLARDRGGALVTSDANLARVAAAVDVQARSISMLAVALRPPYLPGEEITIRLNRPGREHGQGVGFLEDGTMVVVAEAADKVGSDVRVVVTNVLQTTSGRMVFAKLAET